jgi:hypothetical protein
VYADTSIVPAALPSVTICCTMVEPQATISKASSEPTGIGTPIDPPLPPAHDSTIGTVPTLVPSLRQIEPAPEKSCVEKTSAPFALVNPLTKTALEPGSLGKLFTNAVPALVPSVFQRLAAPPVSLEAKKTVPFTSVNSDRDELAAWTTTVPAAVPSLFHEAKPVPGEVAVK